MTAKDLYVAEPGHARGNVQLSTPDTFSLPYKTTYIHSLPRKSCYNPLSLPLSLASPFSLASSDLPWTLHFSGFVRWQAAHSETGGGGGDGVVKMIANVYMLNFGPWLYIPMQTVLTQHCHTRRWCGYAMASVRALKLDLVRLRYVALCYFRLGKV